MFGKTCTPLGGEAPVSPFLSEKNLRWQRPSASRELQQPPEGTRKSCHKSNQRVFLGECLQDLRLCKYKSHSEPPLHPTQGVYGTIQPVNTNEQQEGG